MGPRFQVRCAGPRPAGPPARPSGMKLGAGATSAPLASSGACGSGGTYQDATSESRAGNPVRMSAISVVSASAVTCSFRQRVIYRLTLSQERALDCSGSHVSSYSTDYRVPSLIGGSVERDDLHQLPVVGQHLRERRAPRSFADRDRYRAADGADHSGSRPADGPDVRGDESSHGRIGSGARGT